MSESLENLDPALGRLNLGSRYSDIRLLGEGGMGRVFVATDKQLDKKVAIKLLHATTDVKSIVRFQHEARALSKLQHNYIVTVLDFFVEQSDFVLVMEFVDGLSIEDFLAQGGRMSIPDVLRRACQLCDALGHAHRHGVVHRDLKPSNIVVDKNGDVRILDFGIAKLLTAVDPFGTLTNAGQPIGTPLYMSPEQIRGESTDERTDVYGLGLVLYTMLTGRSPFEAVEFALSLKQKESTEIPSVSSVLGDTAVNAALDRVISVAVEFDPENRFSTMAEFRDELVRINDMNTEITSTGLNQVQVRPKKSILFPVIFVLAGLLAFGSLSWFVFLSGNNDSTPKPPKPKKIVREAQTADPQNEDLVEKVSTTGVYPPGFMRYKDMLQRDSSFSEVTRDMHDFWLADPALTDEQLTCLISTDVTELSLAKNKNITGQGLSKLVNLPIKALDLTDTNIGDNDVRELAYIRTLEWILFDHTKVTIKGLEALAPLKKITRLDFDGCPNFNNDCLKLVIKEFPGLRGLHVGDTAVNREGIPLIAKMTGLQKLWLSDLRVTDEDIESLSHLKLTHLDLASCRLITDRSLKILEKMKTLTQLEVTSCPNITKEAVASLLAVNPHLRLIWTKNNMLKDEPEFMEMYGSQ